MPRTIAIGDIHGGLKALVQLMQRVKPVKEDQLIFLGDYVDGWSQSAPLIDYLIELNNQFSCIFIKGNHDVWCEEWLYNGKTEPVWLRNGGNETIASYNFYSQLQKEQHLIFFNRMKDYYVDNKNRLFIHAGFSSMYGPEKEHHGSSYSWDRTLWELALAMDHRIEKHSVLYPKRLLLYKEIYIGHTPTINYNVDVPMHACNVWNVDTGAAFYGKLSAIDIDTKQYWQSDKVQSLYPNEKGRNK
ncbi:metallophosphoesterase family protein [Chitinophagaceae bacterium LWZ2-11]